MRQTLFLSKAGCQHTDLVLAFNPVLVLLPALRLDPLVALDRVHELGLH